MIYGFEGVLDGAPRELQDYILEAENFMFTGSRVFGYAQEDSDYDVVVYRPEATKDDSLPFEMHQLSTQPDYGVDYGQPLNFKVITDTSRGAPVLLNVIVTNTEEAFHQWARSRDIVLRLRDIGVPINRLVSLAVHQGMRGDQ